MRQFKTLALRSSATFALLGALSLSAQAQVVSVTEDTTDQIRTSIAGPDGTPADVTIGDDDTNIFPTVTIDSARSGVVLDSDNALRLEGNVQADDLDDVTGVELQGGENRSFVQTGTIQLIEDFSNEDTDDDPFLDGGFAEGSGRTGILISGESPFQGNVELELGSSVLVEGNDSFGINLSNTPMMMDGLTGNLLTSGQISVFGDRSIGVNIAGDVTGDLTNEGTGQVGGIIAVRGEDAQGYVISGNVNGGFENSGTITSSAYRFTGGRPFAGPDNDTGREDLTEEDLLQSGSALNVSGNVTGGIFLSQRLEQLLDDAGEPVLTEDGEPTLFVAGASSINQLGSAPAIVIDGGGDILAIGIVAEITDDANEDFDEGLQYGFINQGTVTAGGVFDDVNATAISVANAEIDGGISNSGTLSATALRGATPTDLADGGDGTARVLVIGNQAIVDEINNSGLIFATVDEAIDEIYFDSDNIIAPRPLLAVGVDIEAGATVVELINSGGISANVRGRNGTAIAVRDTSGTLRTLQNSGTIQSINDPSFVFNGEETDFDLIAIDLSTATENVEIIQSQNPDSTNTPLISGNILLGSGDDSVNASAGRISGDIDFGGGNDSILLSGGAEFSGNVLNSDSLALSVTDGSTFALDSTDAIQVSDVLVDGTSVYRPVIDGETGLASTLVSDGSITFEDGASINPILRSIVGTDALSYTLATSDDLSIGDLASLSSGESPFLYSTTLDLADPNTLVVTLDLRNPTASVANGGLGLDAVQAAAFGTVVNGVLQEGAVLQALSASPELGDAFANIIEANDFYSAYNQILPEFSGAAKQFLLANVDGAVGAVGSHLDTARRSPDKTGGAWLQEFFYFADRSLAGRSEQYRGEGFGFAGGLDTEFGPFHAVGVNVGFASTEVEDVVGIDDPLNVQTYQLGAYAGYQSGNFNLDIYGGGGVSDFEQNRRVLIGSFEGEATGEWEAFHANAALRAGYEVALSDKYWMRPSLSVDYLYLNEYGHTETGTQGFRTRVNGRQSETAAATAMLNFGAEFQGKRTWIRPSIRVGYRNEFMSDPTETEFSFQGLSDEDGNLFDSEIARLRAFAFPEEGILLGFTLAAGSEYSSIGFDFDSDIRDGFIRHTGRVVVRLLF